MGVRTMTEDLLQLDTADLRETAEDNPDEMQVVLEMLREAGEESVAELT
jgi:hypothetical protein